MPTKSELKQLLKHWPDHADEIHPIPIIQAKRMSDTSFRVGDDAVLKLYQDQQVLERVLRLADLLGEQGVVASTAHPTADGKPYAAANGVYVALVRRVPGDPLPMDQWFGARGADYAAQAGRALAHLHTALRAVEPKLELRDADLFRTCADWAVPALRQQNAQWNMGLSSEFIDDYLDRFGKLSASLPRQLIHRDPNPSNLMFEGGQFSGFLDYDLFERNARLFDICYAATGVLSECGGSAERYELWPTLLSAIVSGYSEITPLTNAEMQSVYYVVCSIQFIFCAYCESVDNPLIKELAATNRKMLMFIAENREKIG